jgi:hypothetical protein
VIPAYTVNRLIGRIPLIGGLFHEGQGFIAAHFRVSGSLSDPKVTAQPIKSITPSILVRFRKLFQGDDDRAPYFGFGPEDFGPEDFGPGNFVPGRSMPGTSVPAPAAR